MAELHQIVGAILRDIARARVSSDIYSRDISRYYESDALLRRFPVPRSEIEEIELDLRFVVAGVEDDVSNSAGTEASLAPVFADASVDLAQLFFSLLSAAWGQAAKTKDEELWQAFGSLLTNAPERINLHQKLQIYFSRNQGHLVSDGNLVVDDALTGLRGTFEATLARLFTIADQEMREPPTDERERIDYAAFTAALDTKRLIAAQEVRQMVERLASSVAVTVAGGAGGDRRVEVDVTADVLRETPEGAVSNLKLKTFVRNYMWSETHEADGRVWRRLSPE